MKSLSNVHIKTLSLTCEMEPYVHCQPPIVFNELHNIDISGIYERPNANNTGVSSELSLYNHIVGIV